MLIIGLFLLLFIILGSYVMHQVPTKVTKKKKELPSYIRGMFEAIILGTLHDYKTTGTVLHDIIDNNFRDSFLHNYTTKNKHVYKEE